MGNSTPDLLRTPPEYEWSCGVVGPARVQKVSDAGGADQIEAIMMLGTKLTDAEGRRLMFRVPPALAAAIVLMYADGPAKAVEFARAFCAAPPITP